MLWVPFDPPVNTALQLIVQRGATLSVPQQVVVAAGQPGIYTQDQSGNGAGVIVDSAAVVSASTPASAGDTEVIYCNELVGRGTSRSNRNGEYGQCGRGADWRDQRHREFRGDSRQVSQTCIKSTWSCSPESFQAPSRCC